MTRALDAALQDKAARRSCAVSSACGARLSQFCAGLTAGAGSDAAGLRAGVAAAADLLAAPATVDASPDWTGVLEDMPAVGGKKLALTSQQSGALEFFLDANGAFYLGGLTTTQGAAPIALAFEIGADQSVRLLPEGLPARGASERAAIFADPLDTPAVATAIAAETAAATTAAAALARKFALPAQPVAASEPAPPPKPAPAATAAPAAQTNLGFCETCGAPRRADALFCDKCGAKLRPPAAARPEPRTCRACGATAQPDWAFCLKCGAKLPDS